MLPLSELPTEELLGMYWDLAYSEGRRGVNHDTEDGLAQYVLSSLQSRMLPSPNINSVGLMLPKAIQDQLFVAFSDPDAAQNFAQKFCGPRLYNLLEGMQSVLTAKIQLESTGSLSVSQNEARVMYSLDPSINTVNIR
jgi:hypothetical protein